MIVEPYKRPPAAPTVACLTEAGVIVTEHGERLEPDEVPADVRVFAQWDVVRLLRNAYLGEALCWNNEEVRWRETAHEDETEWIRRAGDAYVIRLPLSETLTPKVFLEGLVAWRDWLATVTASPTGTTGSAAMSLLRARLERRLVTGQGDRPPLRSTRGGRMQLGPAGQGRFEGKLVLLDLPSAYAQTLGETVYGGVWRQTTNTAYWLDRSEPMFLRCDVYVPKGLAYGPLVRTFRRRVHFELMQFYGKAVYADGTPWLYPTGRRISGVWTRSEITAAIEAGCKVKIREAWVHRSARQPFLPWWNTIQQGRLELTGVGELLAKMTGNALWGRFCLDPLVAGRRTIVRHSSGQTVELQRRPSAWPAHDLAEHVSGTTRGRLYDLMAWAGDRLLSANTDGAWIRDNGQKPPEDWRVKRRAHRLDLLAPSCLRYWPEKSKWPRVVFAGVPMIEADSAFEKAWEQWKEPAA